MLLHGSDITFQICNQQIVFIYLRDGPLKVDSRVFFLNKIITLITTFYYLFFKA